MPNKRLSISRVYFALRASGGWPPYLFRALQAADERSAELGEIASGGKDERY